MSLFGVIFVRIFPHSDQMRENADQNKAEYGQFYAVIVRSKYENVVLCTAICQAKILNPKIKNPYVYRSIEI